MGRNVTYALGSIALVLQMPNERKELARQLISQIGYCFELVFVKVAFIPCDVQLRADLSGGCLGSSKKIDNLRTCTTLKSFRALTKEI